MDGEADFHGGSNVVPLSLLLSCLVDTLSFDGFI